MSNRFLIYTQNMMAPDAQTGNTNVSHKYICSAFYSSSSSSSSTTMMMMMMMMMIIIIIIIIHGHKRLATHHGL